MKAGRLTHDQQCKWYKNQRRCGRSEPWKRKFQTNRYDSKIWRFIKKKVKAVCHPKLLQFRKSVAFRKVPRLLPLVLLVMATRRSGWVWGNGGMVLTGKNWSTGRQTRHSATSSTINVAGNILGSNRGIHDERPATDRLSHSGRCSSKWQAVLISYLTANTPLFHYHNSTCYCRINKCLLFVFKHTWRNIEFTTNRPKHLA